MNKFPFDSVGSVFLLLVSLIVLYAKLKTFFHSRIENRILKSEMKVHILSILGKNRKFQCKSKVENCVDGK